MGVTGKATGPHLHLEIRKNAERLDAMEMLDGLQASVLILLFSQHLFDVFRINTDFTGLRNGGRNGVAFVGPFTQVDELTAFTAKWSVLVVFGPHNFSLTGRAVYFH